MTRKWHPLVLNFLLILIIPWVVGWTLVGWVTGLDGHRETVGNDDTERYGENNTDHT